MDRILIKQDTPEWENMWGYLDKHPINEGLRYPRIAYNEGEQWQYMGSLRQGARVIHEFRHRNHPTTLEIYNLTFNAIGEITTEQIDKIIKE